MTKLKKGILIIIAVIIVGFSTVRFIDTEPLAMLGGGSGTINQLEQWKTSGGYITQNVASTVLKLTGYESAGDCLVTDASGVVSTAPCGTGGGGGSGGFPVYVQNGGATLNTATTTLDFTPNSFTVIENPTDTFTIRVATTTLGLLSSAISDFVSTVRTSISETITGLTYTSGTGVLSIDSGYEIPTTTRMNTWDSAYGWGNHASQGYLTSIATTTVRGMFSASSPITYNNGTGGFSFDNTGNWAGTFQSQNPSYYLSRANHTGTQSSTTITGLGTLAGKSSVSLTSDVTGNLPVANLNSGTGASASTFWRGDGTWGTPAGAGTVTSVDMSVPTGFTISGNPITGAGTLALGYGAGYSGLLTASSSNWNTFYDTPSNRITAGTGLSWAGNTLNATGGGGGSIGTSSVPTAGKLAYWTSPSTLSDVATTTLTGTAPITFSNVISVIGSTPSAISCALATGSVTGCLSSTDWTSFNGKVSSTSIDTSAELAALLTNETGTGAVMFGTSPAVTTSITTPSTSFTAFAGATTLLTIGGTGASASLFVPSTLDTTSSTTGAIRTSGGISAMKALNIGTTATIGGAITSGGVAVPTISSVSTLTNKTLSGAVLSGALTGTGNYIPVSLLNSGTGASASTFWRGDGTWATPSGSSVSATSTWSSIVQGWIYPGEPACNAETEIQDGRQINTLKVEYLTLGSGGAVTRKTVASDGCNGYTATTSALIASSSREQYITISGASAGLASLMASPSLQQTFIATSTQLATSTGFTGVELDIEGFASWSEADTNKYYTFINELADYLHNNGKKLMVDAPPIWNTASNKESGSGDEWDSANSSSYQYLTYTKLAQTRADYIVIMAYDYMYDYGNGSSIQPLRWVADIANFAKSKIYDKNRIVIGMPSYGYYGTTGGYSQTLQTYTQISAQPGFSGATRDSSSGEMKWTNGGNSYVYNDSTSLDMKRKYIENLGITRVSVWHIGGNQWFTSPSVAGGKLELGNLSAPVIQGLVASSSGTSTIDYSLNGLLTLSNLVISASFKMPYGTNPTISTVGEMALDTTDDQLLVADSAGTVRVFGHDEFRLISTTIASTSLAFTSGNTLAALGEKDGIELTQYRCYVVGGTSKVMSMTDGTNETETITCGTTMTSDTDVATNDTFTADELGYLKFGATTGTVNYVHFEAWGRITRE